MVVQAHFMLDTSGYKHTLRIRNNYGFSIATMLAQVCLNVRLYVHCLYKNNRKRREK